MYEYVELTKQEWVEQGSTQGTATLVARIRARKDGRIIDDGGQGAELPLDEKNPQDAELLEALEADGVEVETGEYNTSPGGDVVTISDEQLKRAGGSIITSKSEIECVRNETAFYAHNAYRLPATPTNTFLLQCLGRTAVEFAYAEASYGPTEKVLNGKVAPYGNHFFGISEEHWGNLTASARRYYLSPAFFANRDMNPDDAIIAMIDDLIDKNQLHRLSSLLISYPLNPTSQPITVHQMSRIVHKVSDTNRHYNTDIHLIIDFPYAWASAVHTDARGRYLDTGLQHTLDEVDNIHWTFIASTSKLLSMAKTGQTIVVVDQKRAHDISPKLCRNGIGLARVNQLNKNIASLLGGDKQEILWRRKDNIRDKYETDDKSLVEAFNNHLVPGSDKGMLRLMEFPVSDMFNRKVFCTDGKYRVLRDGFDVVTYLANEFGAALVANELRGDQLCLRVAKRERPQVFQRFVRNMKDGLEHIRQSDAVPAMALRA